jgi:hypothetical protein
MTFPGSTGLRANIRPPWWLTEAKHTSLLKNCNNILVKKIYYTGPLTLSNIDKAVQSFKKSMVSIHKVLASPFHTLGPTGIK